MTMTNEATPAAARERPRVPRSRLSTTAIALGVFGGLVVGGYSALAYSNYEPSAARRGEIPASVRSSPGGYRTHQFWYSGYHGGK
jgi:murein DD-endopeptidase MepM/ murein hydrolase activator NlpD